MPELNKDRIFNESSKKVLIREFNALKSDYSKLNAIKYFSLYENESLSFIIENSRYIFSEPIKGLGFYKEMVESNKLPFDKILEEKNKIDNFITEHVESMSEKQANEYRELSNTINMKYENNKNSIHLYESIMDEGDNTACYDALYEYHKSHDEKYLDTIRNVIFESDDWNIMDAINIGSSVPELSSDLYKYIDSSYVNNPLTPDECGTNAIISNIVSCMLKDKDVKDSVCNINNMNTRHIILGVGGISNSDMITDVTKEEIEQPKFVTTEYTINSIFEDGMMGESYDESDDEVKLCNLRCEKAIIDVNLGFLIIESMNSDDDQISSIYDRNSIVEKICVESSDIEKIPTTYTEQIAILENESKRLDEEINLITEKYFSNNGGPSKIVAASIGDVANDKTSSKTGDHSRQDYDDEEDDEKEVTSKKKNSSSKKDKDIDFDEVKEDEVKFTEVKKPAKKNIFQRIQNKALDANVKFKKVVAEGKRKSVDAKNAGKAVGKIPLNITDSIKKQVDEWDEMDDDRRKAYIAKPGFRKKYFKALKLCLLHYGAFAINPVLNIVLAICHKFSNTKDVRIRNELTRELNAEIAIIQEKIEDARSEGDKEAKYKLMRYKEKLEAEVTRISANSTFV